jgi:putative FmdB family regulatory protein
MPRYDYRCVACLNEVEVMHAIDAPGPEVCELCGGAMRKALSTPAIHFKGSGWAKKDAQSASKAAAKANKPKVDKEASTKGDGNGSSPKEASSASDSGRTAKAEATPAAASSTSSD